MKLRETIGWIEQDGPEAFFCFKDSAGNKVSWLLIEMRCRPYPDGSGGGKQLPAAFKVAA